MQQQGLPSRKQIHLELEILNSPYFQSRRGPFVDMVELLQGLDGVRDVRRLQLELIAEIGALETVGPELDAEHGDSARRQLRQLKVIEPKTPEVISGLREANDALARVRLSGELLKAVNHVTRVIADGMVWRLLGFDRSAIGLLAGRQVVAKHAAPVGFAAELVAMDTLEQSLQTTVIHNDSTYCLRFGDVTAIVEEDGRRRALPFEVKAGRASATRQQAEIEAIVTRIADDRLLVPVPAATQLSELEPMIAQATAAGYAEQRLDCRLVQVIDYRHFGGREAEVASILTESDRKLGWSGVGDRVTTGIASAARIRDRGDPLAWIAPISIYPLPADQVVDLMMGAVDIRVHLNTDLMALEFAKRGITIDVFRGKQAKVDFLHARRGYLGLVVPACLREQLLYELLSTDALVDLVEWVLDSGETVRWSREGHTPVIAFADESTIWTGGDAPVALAA